MFKNPVALMNLLHIHMFPSQIQLIGQTGRTFIIRYKEHIHAIRNNSNSGYSNHIPNTGHTYGTIIDAMDIIKTGKKVKYFNNVEMI
jgi:hypothetical protein